MKKNIVSIKKSDLVMLTDEECIKEARKNPALIKQWEETLQYMKDNYPDDNHDEYQFARVLRKLKGN